MALTLQVEIRETGTASEAAPNGASFPDAEACRLASHLLSDGYPFDTHGRYRIKSGRAVASCSVGVSPGGITLHRRLMQLGRDAVDDALEAAEARDDGQDELRFPVDQAEDVDPPHGPPIPSPPSPCRWWSDRSRARMIRALAAVDWAPVFNMRGTRPAMVTLTYPGDWLTVAPDAETAKSHLASFRKRLNRQFDKLGLGPVPCVWKLEFQRRGAPHFHLYMPVPVGRFQLRGEMANFQQWASEAWADIVAHPDLEQRRRHRLAGTGVDFAEGSRCSDPKRLAIYFTRHNAKGGRSKAHQHRVPDAWTGAGRWWSTWGVDRIEFETPITDGELVAVKRLLRAWVRAESRPGGRGRDGTIQTRYPGGKPRVAARRVRRGISPAGVVQYRWVSRRYGLASLSGGAGGFVIANDGPALAAMLSRFLDSIR